MAECAEFLSVSQEGVYRLVKDGRIPSMRLQKRLRFSPEAVKQAMKGSK